MYTRKELLAMAKQYRMCPPPDVASRSACKELVEKHISLCPYCGEKNKEIELWHSLTKKILKTLYGKKSFPKKLSDEKIRKGEFRFIKPELGCWEEGFYYNPPLVLVLDITNEISNDLLVSQVYHDIGLAGPGDLILSARQTKLNELFVEPWNTYTLKADYLGRSVGYVKNNILSDIMAMAKNPDFLPPWAKMPRPFTDDNDPRIYFRKLEIQVGYVFSSRAVAALMQEHSYFDLDYPSMDALIHTIKKYAQNVYWLYPPETFEETLATAQFHQLAAADTGEKEIIAKIIMIKNRKLISFKPVPARILQKKFLSGKITLSGRVAEFPESGADSALLSFWIIDENQCLTPSISQWDSQTGSFYLEFDAQKEIQKHPEIAIVIFSDKDASHDH